MTPFFAHSERGAVAVVILPYRPMRGIISQSMGGILPSVGQSVASADFDFQFIA